MNNILRRDVGNSGKSSLKRNGLPDTNIILPKPTEVPAFMVKNKCRVCLHQGDIPVFSKKNSLDFPLSHYLKIICNIDINTKDAYPKHLCQTCCDALDSAIKLRKTAIKSQLKLKTSLSHLHMRYLKNADKKYGPDLITSSPLKKEIVSMNYQDLSILEPLQKEECDNDFEEVDQTDNSDDPVQSLLQNKNIKTNQIEYNPEVPTLSIEEVKKLQSKIIPYEKYYQKVFTTDNKLKYQCRICKNAYKKGSIADHILTHLPDSVSLYVCEVCGKTFKKFCVFYQHRSIHKNVLPFECKLCPYKGRSKSLLQVHVKGVHKKEYKYQCTLCPKKFLDTNNLRYHLRRHAEPKFQCSTCHKSFYENGLLKKHIHSQHMDSIPHKCDICGNMYKHRKSMLTHQIKVHKRKQVYNNRATYLKLESGSVAHELEIK